MSYTRFCTVPIKTESIDPVSSLALSDMWCFPVADFGPLYCIRTARDKTTHDTPISQNKHSSQQTHFWLYNSQAYYSISLKRKCPAAMVKAQQVSI